MFAGVQKTDRNFRFKLEPDIPVALSGVDLNRKFRLPGNFRLEISGYLLQREELVLSQNLLDSSPTGYSGWLEISGWVLRNFFWSLAKIRLASSEPEIPVDPKFPVGNIRLTSAIEKADLTSHFLVFDAYE